VSRSLERKEQQEVGIFDVDVKLVIDRVASYLYVRNVEEAGIRSAWELDTQLSANR
jgi:hypothetical protein